MPLFPSRPDGGSQVELQAVAFRAAVSSSAAGVAACPTCGGTDYRLVQSDQTSGRDRYGTVPQGARLHVFTDGRVAELINIEQPAIFRLTVPPTSARFEYTSHRRLTDLQTCIARPCTETAIAQRSSVTELATSSARKCRSKWGSHAAAIQQTAARMADGVITNVSTPSNLPTDHT